MKTVAKLIKKSQKKALNEKEANYSVIEMAENPKSLEVFCIFTNFALVRNASGKFPGKDGA